MVDGESNDDPATTGEAAHIAGEKETSARYDPRMTDAERDHYDNLIYMCRDHHAQIDAQEKAFPVRHLLEMKKNHEAKVRQAVKDGFAEVGFPELARATEYLSRTEGEQPSDDFSSIPPEDKIRKNELTPPSVLIIRTGLGIMPEVRSFVEKESVVDAEFPERLKSGFLVEYHGLRKNGHRGDELFDLMCVFAQRGMKTQSERSAGLAVLTYLFNLCEVFEK